jgi:hypothetical protein
MFVGKAGAYPSEAPKARAYPRVEHLKAASLGFARDNHARLLRKSVNYGHEKFMAMAQGSISLNFFGIEFTHTFL